MRIVVLVKPVPDTASSGERLRPDETFFDFTNRAMLYFLLGRDGFRGREGTTATGRGARTPLASRLAVDGEADDVQG